MKQSSVGASESAARQITDIIIPQHIAESLAAQAVAQRSAQAKIILAKVPQLRRTPTGRCPHGSGLCVWAVCRAEDTLAGLCDANACLRWPVR